MLVNRAVLVFAFVLIISLIVVIPAWAGRVDVASTSGSGSVTTTLMPNISRGVNIGSISLSLKDMVYGCTSGGFCSIADVASLGTNSAVFSVAYLGYLYGNGPNHHHKDPVPEPASLVLYGSGLALVAFAIRRRRAR
jgi:hypothetical protein